MAKPDQAAGHGRASAPGQQKVHTFQNEAGDQVTGTMNEFHSTLKAQGYRPVDDAAAEAAETDAGDATAPADAGGEAPA